MVIILVVVDEQLACSFYGVIIYFILFLYTMTVYSVDSYNTYLDPHWLLEVGPIHKTLFLHQYTLFSKKWP